MWESSEESWIEKSIFVFDLFFRFSYPTTCISKEESLFTYFRKRGEIEWVKGKEEGAPHSKGETAISATKISLELSVRPFASKIQKTQGKSLCAYAPHFCRNRKSVQRKK